LTIKHSTTYVDGTTVITAAQLNAAHTIEDDTIAEGHLIIVNSRTDGYVLAWSDSDGKLKWVAQTGGGGSVWGSITGTLSNQTDLQNALNAKAASSHVHAATDITSETLDGDRLPALSATKKGGAPATGTPSGKYLKDDGTWSSPSGSGDVVGPSSAVDSRLAAFDGTTGKLIMDSGKLAGDFETSGSVATHAALTGTHGVTTIDGVTERNTAITTHAGLTTGVHGVGAGTVAKVGDIATDTNLSANAQDAVSKRHSRSHLVTGTSDHDPTGLTASQLVRLNAAATALESSGKVITDFEASGAVSTHAALTTGVHGVGAGTVSKVADIAVDTNLSAAAQAAITASHTQSHAVTSTSDHTVAALTASQLIRLNAAATALESSGKVIGDFAASSHVHAATDITSETLDGNRLPVLSTTKRGGVPATGTPSGKYLKDDDTWATPSGGGSGDVVGPASAADSNLAAFDGVTGKLIKDAGVPAHAKQHAITATADHTSTATSGRMLKADANGLPVDATNTDTAVAAAVTASHTHNTDTITVLNPALADHAYSGVSISATAGETLTIGQICYRKSDGLYWLAKANAVGTMPALVIATAAVAASQVGTFLEYGLFRDDSLFAWTVGGALYVSAASAGSMTQTAPSTTGQYVQCVGEALSADIVKWNPNRVMVKIA
jgi:hypothetical protein